MMTRKACEQRTKRALEDFLAVMTPDFSHQSMVDLDDPKDCPHDKCPFIGSKLRCPWKVDLEDQKKPYRKPGQFYMKGKYGSLIHLKNKMRHTKTLS